MNRPLREHFRWQATGRVLPVTSHSEWCCGWQATGRVLPVTSHSASSFCDKPQCMALRWQATGRVFPLTSHSARCYGDKPPHTNTILPIGTKQPKLRDRTGFSRCLTQNRRTVSDRQKQWFWLGKKLNLGSCKKVGLVTCQWYRTGASASTTYQIMTDRNSDIDRGLWTQQEGGTGDLPVILVPQHRRPLDNDRHK